MLPKIAFFLKGREIDRSYTWSIEGQWPNVAFPVDVTMLSQM